MLRDRTPRTVPKKNTTNFANLVVFFAELVVFFANWLCFFGYGTGYGTGTVYYRGTVRAVRYEGYGGTVWYRGLPS